MTPLFLFSVLTLALAVVAVPISLLAIKGIGYLRNPIDPENPLSMASDRTIEQMFEAGWDSPLYRSQLEELIRTRLCRRPLAEVSTGTIWGYVILAIGLGVALGLITFFTAAAPTDAPRWLGAVLAALATIVGIGLAMDLTSSLVRFRAAHGISRRFERHSGTAGARPRSSIEDLALKAVAFSAGALVFRLAVVVADAAAVVSLVLN